MTCSPENAALFATWIAERGGLAIWGSLNLADPATSYTTPVRTAEGTLFTKPHWSCTNEPVEIITKAEDVIVEVPKEVGRFHVAVRMHGLSLKLTDGASRRVRTAVAKAGDDAWYDFDRSTQEAVIFVPSEKVPLPEWISRQ